MTGVWRCGAWLQSKPGIEALMVLMTVAVPDKARDGYEVGSRGLDGYDNGQRDGR